jgi:hypothetical protein
MLGQCMAAVYVRILLQHKGVTVTPTPVLQVGLRSTLVHTCGHAHVCILSQLPPADGYSIACNHG